MPIEKPGWIRMETRVAKGGASVATVSLDLIASVFQGSPSARQFQANMQEITSKMMMLFRYTVFPSVQAEVIWKVAGICTLRNIQPGELLVEDGETTVDNDFLIVIDSGVAAIKKLAYRGEAPGENWSEQVLGWLGQSAVIGDVSFLGANMAWPATVRAEKLISALYVSTDGFLNILQRFPGMLANFTSRLRDATSQLQDCLPRPAEALPRLSLFSSCSANFLRTIGASCQRKIHFASDIIREEGSPDKSLRVIEFGKCFIIKKDPPLRLLSEQMTILGERRFFDLPHPTDVSVTVATPLVFVLAISKQPFKVALEKYPAEKSRWKLKNHGDGGHGIGGHCIDVPLLRQCGKGFVDAVTATMDTATFKPGQTILIQTAADSGALFVIRAGEVDIHVSGVSGRITLLQYRAGECFGERAILGFVSRRTASCRAVKLCICMRIHKGTFLNALEEFPLEQVYFHEFAAARGMVAKLSGWPMMEPACNRTRSLWVVYAKKQITAKSKWTTAHDVPLPLDAAVLLLRGEITIRFEDGTTKLMPTGSCFGEGILLGYPPVRHFELVPMTNCEIQIMTKDCFDKILSEVDEQEAEKVKLATLNEVASKFEEDLGFEKGSHRVLSYSALFRQASEALRTALRTKMRARAFNAGELITVHDQKATEMMIMICGNAQNEGDGSQMEVSSTTHVIDVGYVCGELNLLGVSNCYLNTLRATTFCMVECLSSSDFWEVLEEYPLEKQAYRRLVAEEEERRCDLDVMQLREVVQKSKAFKQASPGFIEIACQGADDIFFAPGEDIMKRGEKCKLGETCMYVLVVGTAAVISEFGSQLGTNNPGDVIGELGALGFLDERSCWVRSRKDGMVHVMRLHGPSLGRAVAEYPSEYEDFRAIANTRLIANKETLKSRTELLENKVAPLLRGCAIFSKFPQHLLFSIAEQLVLKHFSRGRSLCKAAQPADSLIMILEGEADVINTDHHVISRLTSGAVFGEVCMLGVFQYRTATLRARTTCQVCEIARDKVWEVLQQCHATEEQETLKRLQQDRCWQVERGLPMSALPLGANADEMCTQAISLHAELVKMRRGQIWHPRADRLSAMGPSYWIMTKGCVEIVTDTQYIAAVNAGLAPAVIPEKLVSEFKACIRVKNACEAWQVRRMDLLLATASKPPKWLKSFQSLLDDATESLRFRIINARSITKMKCRQRSKSKTPTAWSKESSQSVMSLPTMSLGLSMSVSSLPGVELSGTPPSPQSPLSPLSSSSPKPPTQGERRSPSKGGLIHLARLTPSPASPASVGSPKVTSPQAEGEVRPSSATVLGIGRKSPH
eukprot:TRINITY_DN29174_c0_g1_i2.p1 TRINITY_DN29174_c0_g1~~TRINITY_DN29174_c0_g1_i2.p1  ORF type:complete len:1466 (-),score=249.70 TRINITY_DN29174_c0_g1_i2:91-4023(-)